MKEFNVEFRKYSCYLIILFIIFDARYVEIIVRVLCILIKEFYFCFSKNL